MALLSLLGIFQLVFGDFASFKEFIKKITDVGGVDEINEVFYGAVFKALGSSKINPSTRTALSTVMSTNRNKLIELFETEIEDEKTYENILSSDFKLTLAKRLIELCKDYSDVVDIEEATKVVDQIIQNFHDIVYEQLSEKQGIYILLKRSGIDTDKINKILEKQTETLDIVIETSNKVDQLIAKDYSHEILELVRDDYKFAYSLCLKHDYVTAISIFQKGLDTLKSKSIDDLKTFFHLYANLAVCYKLIGEEGKSHETTVKAYDCAKENPKAIYAAYISYLDVNDNNRASILKEILLKDNSNSIEWYCTQFLDVNEVSEEILAIINKAEIAFPNSPEILFGIAKIFYRSGDIHTYKAYVEKVLEVEPLGALSLKPSLAFNLHNSITSPFINREKRMLDEKQVFLLNEAIRLYMEVWEEIKDTAYKKSGAPYLLNVSTIYVTMGNWEKALELIEKAIEIDPSDRFYAQKMMYYYELGKDQEALACSKFIKNFYDREMESALQLYLLLLVNSEKQDKEKSLEIINEYLSLSLSKYGKLFGNFQYLKGLILLANKREQEAIIHVDSLINVTPESSHFWVLKSRILFDIGHFDQSREAIFNAIKFFDKDTSQKEVLFELCDQLFRLEQYEEYIRNIYKFDIDKLTFRQLQQTEISIINLGRNDILSFFYNDLIDKIGIHEYFGLRFIEFLREVLRDYRMQYNLAKLYNEKFPDIFDGKMALCRALIDIGKIDEAKQVDLSIDLNRLDFFNLNRLIVLKIEMSLIKDAELILYERFRIKQDFELVDYILKLNLNVKATTDELSYDTVKINSVVTIKNIDSDELIEYVIFDKPDADFDRFNEINSVHRLYNKLIGALVGDEIIIESENKFKKANTYTIIKVISLRQFLFNESFELIRTKYKDKSDILAIQSSDITKVIGHVNDIIKENDNTERNQVISDLYKQYLSYQIPIGLLCNICNFNIVSLINTLRDTDVEIPISEKSDIENQILDSVKSNFKGDYCLDVTAIINLHQLEDIVELVKRVGKFKISQTTYNYFRRLDLERNTFANTGFPIAIYNETNKPILVTSQVAYENTVKDISKIMSWIDIYCHSPIPVYSRIHFQKESENSYLQVLGELSFDTILLSIEKGYVPVIDDYMTKMICIQEFRRNCINSIDFFS